MTSVSIKHMLSDYERWKMVFEVLSSGQHGIKVVSYSTEMDKSNPSILITQLQLGDRDTLSDTEPIVRILDGMGLSKRYEMNWETQS